MLLVVRKSTPVKKGCGLPSGFVPVRSKIGGFKGLIATHYAAWHARHSEMCHISVFS